MYQFTIIISLVLSSLTYAGSNVSVEKIQLNCQSLPFESSRTSCMQATKDINFVQKAPWSVCQLTKRVNTDDYVECINIIKNRSFDSNEALSCADEMLNDDKLDCLREVGGSSKTPSNDFQDGVSISRGELIGAMPGVCTYKEYNEVETYPAMLYTISTKSGVATYQIRIARAHNINEMSTRELQAAVEKISNGKLHPATASQRDVSRYATNSIFQYLYNLYEDNDGVSLTSKNTSCNMRGRCFIQKIRQSEDGTKVLTKGKNYVRYGTCVYDKTKKVRTYRE